MLQHRAPYRQRRRVRGAEEIPSDFLRRADCGAADDKIRKD